MREIRILTEAELRDVVTLDGATVDCIEQAFLALATREVVMPPVLSMQIAQHNGEVDVKTAFVPGLSGFAVKISPGFFDNPALGLPSLSGLMVPFDARTGMLEAVLLDNGYLTDVRTAAAGAVAARWLARADASVAGIVGSGTQARLQLEALTRVRDIRSAIVWGRNPERARTCARECADRLGIPVRAEDELRLLVEHSDVIVTTTPSQVPLIEAGWLQPGQHVTAMGSDAEYKTELAPAVLSRASLYVCDSIEQCLERGELRAAVAAGVLEPSGVHAQLGAVVAGTAPGRTDAEQITVCDLTGTGVQDTAIATLAHARAVAAGLGLVSRS